MKQRAHRLLIRADAGVSIGHGHVMRMLALAQAWTHRGGSVKFLCASCPESLQQRLRQEGCGVERFPGEIAVGAVQDVENTAEVIEAWGAAGVVLDGYAFDETYVADLQSRVSIPICCVVDAEPSKLLLKLADRIVYPCLAPAHRAMTEEARLLKGREFVLIRPEFMEALHRQEVKPACKHRGDSLHLLLCMGGSDPQNVSGKILQTLLAQSEQIGHARPLSLRLIAGASHPHLATLEAHMACAPTEQEWEIQVDARDMPAQFEWADAVISAAGGMVWEWLLFGLPGAVVAIAENQQGFYRDLVNAGWATGLGDLTQDPDVLDGSMLRNWMDGLSDLDSTRGNPPIDGLGAKRIAERLSRLV